MEMENEVRIRGRNSPKPIPLLSTQALMEGEETKKIWKLKSISRLNTVDLRLVEIKHSNGCLQGGGWAEVQASLELDTH